MLCVLNLLFAHVLLGPPEWSVADVDDALEWAVDVGDGNEYECDKQ